MPKKIPVRMCAACRRHTEKENLIRIVKTADEGIVIDRTNKLGGRGVYLCKSADCLQLAVKKKALERAYKSAIDASVYDALKEEIESGG